MTEAERRIARALGLCSFLPGSWDKRFARALAFLEEHDPEHALTERQRANLARLAHKYRRQMPPALAAAASTLTSPDAPDPGRTG